MPNLHLPAGKDGDYRHDDGDGVVDYPLSLAALIVEQRGKIVYVNQMVDASRGPVRLRGTSAAYGDPETVGNLEDNSRRNDSM